MRRRTRKIVAWQWPPRPSTPCLRTRETFPGKSFAEKGARWLNLSLPSDYQPEQRKQFAKQCFQAAVKRCNSAAIKAKKANKKAEAAKLAEMATWLEQQYLNQL